MYLKEVFAGRYDAQPKITDFPNAKSLDQVYTLGPITVRSACSHHMVPITGRCWIGILPSDRVIGISKFVRLANWVLARPQIQEEATVQLADIIEELIKPKGLAVVIEATHQCMTWRGVKESETKMNTSVMRGAFRDEAETRAEFFRLIK
jgi:GTP cyclohydrolase I